MGLISWIKRKNFERKTARLVAELEEQRIIRKALDKELRRKKKEEKSKAWIDSAKKEQEEKINKGV